MTAQLIFKMEFYKFFNDRKNLIFIAVLTFLNIIFSVNLMGNNSDSGVLFMLTFICSIVIIFITPFQLLSQDYRSNVMAIMIASGVNRRKLFFAKLLSTVIISVCIGVLLFIFPMILVIARAGFEEFIYILQQVFQELSLYINYPLAILYLIFSYVTYLVMINAAVIFTKGSRAAISLFFGIEIAISILNVVIVSPFINNMDLSSNGSLIVQIVFMAITGIAAILLSLRRMDTQSL